MPKKNTNLSSIITVKISFLQTIKSLLSGLVLGLLVIGTVGSHFFFQQTKDTFYNGTYVNGVDVSGLTKQQAFNKITSTDTASSSAPVMIAVDDIVISSSSGELKVQKNISVALDEAFTIARTGFPLKRLQTILDLRLNPQNTVALLTADEKAIQAQIQALAAQANIEGYHPSASLQYSQVPSSLSIDPGKIGREVVEKDASAMLLAEIEKRSTLESPLMLQAPVASTAATLSEAELPSARERALSFIGTQLTFTAEEQSINLNDQAIINLLAFPAGFRSDYDETITSWKAAVEREPQEPSFVYNTETLEVSEFVPPRDGITLNEIESKTTLTSALEQLEKNIQRLAQAEQTEVPLEGSNANTEEETISTKLTFQLPIQTKAPNKSLADTNNLGIVERIGYGDSEYDHSIPSRIHNVAITAEKITNHIIAPGDEFSFNRALGEVSRRTGYQPAYVIKGGRTVLGDGGGVCQVSTTLFRSVLDAGLEVSKRLQHSYRVSYYELNEKPGIDATVYSGDIDFRFVNDTDNYILVHTKANSEDLTMFVELYGTSDGRQTEIVDHEVWDFRPPPPPVYTDDPSLPTGVVRQVDWAVSGVKTRFTNVVKDADGNIIREDEYYSNYVPWSAKYIRGV